MACPCLTSSPSATRILDGVGVQRVVLASVVDDDQVAIATEPARVQHVPGGHGRDARPLRHIDIDPVPERLGSEPRMHLRPVFSDHPAVRRPGQPAAKTGESRTRPAASIGGAGRDRAVGGGPLAAAALPLLLLKIPDECLQPPGRLGQLPHHPVVVGALVLDRARSTCRCAASLSASARSSSPRSQSRQLLLPRLQASLPLGQALGSHTILSNQSSVHRGQRGQMPELDRLGDADRRRRGGAAARRPGPRACRGPGAAGSSTSSWPSRCRPSLPISAWRSPISAWAFLILPSSVTTCLRLSVTRLIDGFQLGEQPRLPLLGVRRLLALLVEALLRLLEILLLLADVGAVALLSGRGQRPRGQAPRRRRRAGLASERRPSCGGLLAHAWACLVAEEPADRAERRPAADEAEHLRERTGRPRAAARASPGAGARAGAPPARRPLRARRAPACPRPAPAPCPAAGEAAGSRSPPRPPAA